MSDTAAYSASEAAAAPKEEKPKVVASNKKLKQARTEVRKATALVASMEKAMADKKSE